MIAAVATGFNSRRGAAIIRSPPRGRLVKAYIGIGTNLGDLPANLETALTGLAAFDLKPTALSSVWETEPIDTPSTDWFLNMAAEVSTTHEPLELLEVLLEIERRAGRVRRVPNGSRTLDLDLLLMGDLVLDLPRLSLPHPAMWNRRFVLEPLAEIAADARHPVNGRSVDERRLRIRGHSKVRRLGDLATARALLHNPACRERSHR